MSPTGTSNRCLSTRQDMIGPPGYRTASGPVAPRGKPAHLRPAPVSTSLGEMRPCPTATASMRASSSRNNEESTAAGHGEAREGGRERCLHTRSRRAWPMDERIPGAGAVFQPEARPMQWPRRTSAAESRTVQQPWNETGCTSLSIKPLPIIGTDAEGRRARPRMPGRCRSSRDCFRLRCRYGRKRKPAAGLLRH